MAGHQYVFKGEFFEEIYGKLSIDYSFYFYTQEHYVYPEGLIFMHLHSLHKHYEPLHSLSIDKKVWDT